MKKIEIKASKIEFQLQMRHHESLNDVIQTLNAEASDDATVSDGYHTFDDLYAHRVALFIAIARLCQRQEKKIEVIPDKPFVWRSKNHSVPVGGKELPMFDGQYIMGIGNFEGEQITYHLPLSTWEETWFASTLEYAPRFDGHTSDDVLKRLGNL